MYVLPSFDTLISRPNCTQVFEKSWMACHNDIIGLLVES